MERLATPQTLDQQRARNAWLVVEKIALSDEKTRRQFGIQVKRLPMRILASGLGQALAFLEAKDYSPDLRIALSDWIQNRRPHATEASSAPSRLLERLIHSDAEFQRFATAECLAYLTWLVRFADSRQLTDAVE